VYLRILFGFISWA